MRGPVRFDRRALLKGVAVAPLAISVPALAQNRIPVVDMHAHFFNAADLPIAGFASHVLFHGVIGRVPGGRAALDLLSRLGQTIAATADEELREIGQAADQNLTPDRFGALSADFV